MSHELKLTEAEKALDEIIKQQRLKGREHYGKGLDWEEGLREDGPYDWRQMALEEAVDLSQYLVAELTAARFDIDDLKQTVTELQAGDDTEGKLTLERYQELACVTMPADEAYEKSLAIRSLGLAGEVGEVVELIKKHLGHGHELDKEKVAKELGDVLWYVATLAAALDISLGKVGEKNIDKLKARYPEGFSHEASRNRVA